MKKNAILCLMLMLVSSSFFAGCVRASSGKSPEGMSETTINSEMRTSKNSTKIQVAILLDTSGSMQGLIEQTKSRLWNIVNTLTTLKYQGKSPSIEIALYEYGSYEIKNSEYIRQVAPLTADLDLISEKLFALRAGGSEEYCGAVIDKAVRSLEWGNNETDIKLIYIAGNEVFTQGRISYKTAIQSALNKNIYVNTIHCGDPETGIRDLWRDAAIRGQGKFFNINSNVRVRHVVTPYDDRISHYNSRLNDTYLSFGHKGHEKKENQARQDMNAKSISGANYAERAVSKSKSVYNNSSWDLVDKMKEDSNALAAISNDELPSELKDKSDAEIKKIVSEKEKERVTIQKEIAELAKKRQAYIDEELKKDGDEDDLGNAINRSIVDFANKKGYTVESL